MKYIVMKVQVKEDFIIEIPFVFPEIIVHANIADFCKVLLEKHFPAAESIQPISAGFCSSMAFEDDCYGESETLKLKSRPQEDSALIKMCDYGSMYV